MSCIVCVDESGNLSANNLSGTNTGDQTITLTGDVTGFGTGSFATTISNDAVTFAKLQNIATDKLIGRDTAGTGDPEEIGVGGGIEFTGSGAIQRSALSGDVSASAGSNSTTLATVNSNVGSFTNASITVNAKGLITAASTGAGGDWQFISSQTVTSASTVVFTGLASGYDYMIGFNAVNFAATTVMFSLQYSSDNGSSWLASSYTDAANGFTTQGVDGSNSEISASAIALTGSYSAASASMGGYVQVLDPGAATIHTALWQIFFKDQFNYYHVMNGGGHRMASETIDAIRLLTHNGTNITSGRFTLYRRKNQ